MKHSLSLPAMIIRLMALASLIHATSIRAADEVLPGMGSVEFRDSGSFFGNGSKNAYNCALFSGVTIVINGPMDLNPLSRPPSPSLVVLGTSRLVQDNGDSPGVHRIEIEKVLFGHYEGKEVDYAGQPGREGRHIYFLSPAPYKGPADFKWFDMMDASKLKVAQALCDNRFDGIVLGADAIFVGTEVPPPKLRSESLPVDIPPGATVRLITGGGSSWEGYTHEVKVVRQINGKPMKIGDSVTGIIDDFVRVSGSAEEPVHPEERIYFASGPLKDQVDGRTAYRITPMPVEIEAQVKEALARRDSYPVSTDSFGAKRREILFRGTPDEALDLLTAGSPAAVDLGWNYFLYHPEARPVLVARISAGMFATGVAKGNEFLTQWGLIECLDEFELKSPSGAIPALIEQMLARLEKETPSVPMPGRDPEKHISRMMVTVAQTSEEDTTDVNHTLAWLVMKMDEDEVAARWGARLQALRPRLTGWWRQETDLADTVARVDQNQTLAALTARMKDVKPVAFIFPLSENGEVAAVAVSPDGRLIATSPRDHSEGRATIIRNAADFKKLSQIPARADHLVFSPDGNTLYLSGGSEKGAAFSSYDWRAGKLIKCYTADPSASVHGMILAPDGKSMYTDTYVDGGRGWLVWDIRSGKIVRTIPALGALSPDGKSFAHFYKPGDSAGPGDISGILVDRLDSASKGDRYTCHLNAEEMVFTPDARYLVYIGSDIAHWTIECMDLERKGELMTSLDFNATPTNTMQLVISPDGKYAAVGYGEYGDGSVCVYSPPLMVPAWSTHFPGNVESLAFSPDSKTLYIANSGFAPMIIEMASFSEVIPYTGHPTWVGQASFSADGKQIITFGYDRTICHWDPATWKMTARFATPPGCQLLSVGPSGRYALYIESSQPNPLNNNREKTTKKAYIVDAGTGDAVFSFDINTGVIYTNDPDVYWLPGGEVLLFSTRVDETARIDYLHGRVLDRVDTQHTNFEGDTYLARDRNSLLFVPGQSTEIGHSYVYVHDKKTDTGATLLNLSTGKSTPAAVEKDGDTYKVDGQTYDALTSFQPYRRYPDMPQLQGVGDSQSGLFSPDGRRFVTHIEDDDSSYRDDPHHKKPKPSLFVVYDAATRQGICAFHSPHDANRAIFNADGTRLIVTNGRSIELWPLPK